MTDCVLDYMKKHDVPMTRENYLELAYLGNPPSSLSAEEESELPEEFQTKQPSAGIEALSGTR